MSKALRATLAFLLIALTGPRQTMAAAEPTETCGQFVQQFYDWYLARQKTLMKENSEESAMEVALREKQSSFIPELVKALQDDLAASKKVTEEIVGLDFDPFLNAQDEPEKYVVGDVHPKCDRSLVDVFGVWNGKKNAKPDVVPELMSKDGHWIFTNFHYGKSDIPVNENLLSVLQQLKKDREKTAK